MKEGGGGGEGRGGEGSGVERTWVRKLLDTQANTTTPSSNMPKFLFETAILSATAAAASERLFPFFFAVGDIHTDAVRSAPPSPHACLRVCSLPSSQEWIAVGAIVIVAGGGSGNPTGYPAAWR